jgi:hypothetical protein
MSMDFIKSTKVILSLNEMPWLTFLIRTLTDSSDDNHFESQDNFVENDESWTLTQRAAE